MTKTLQYFNTLQHFGNIVHILLTRKLYASAGLRFTIVVGTGIGKRAGVRDLLDNLVRKMLNQGATSAEVVQAAIRLSREVYQQLLKLEEQLDQAFGGSEFRRASIEPLVQKNRQIEAIRSRVREGGSLRTSDTGSLHTLLERRIAEYESLNSEFPWDTLASGQRNLVRNYLQERREHLELGDVERVQSAYRDALCTAAVAC